MPSVAIVVTCFNHSAYTRQAIESLRRTTHNINDYKFDFAVFDDCSTDNTKDVVRSAGCGKVKYWRSKRNMGVTYLWNEAYRQYSDFDYLALVNNDVIFTPNWCGRILDLMRKRNKELAGPITNGPGHVTLQDVRKYVPDYEPSDKWKDLLDLSEYLQHRQSIEAKRINGFCMVFSTTLLYRAQTARPGEPFDPVKRNFGNEDEIQSRHDPRPLIIPSSFVFHYKRVTIPGQSSKFVRFRPDSSKPTQLA